MSRVITSVIFTCYMVCATAQIHVSPSVSYNSFAMGDMKEIQREAQADIIIPTKTVSEFPPFWGFGIDVFSVQDNWENVHMELGGILYYTSTGGSTNVADFSGYLKFDQLVNKISFGPSIRLMQKQEAKNRIGAELSAFFSLSNLKLISDLSVNGETEYQSLRFQSTSGQIQVMFVDRFHISSGYFLVLKGGYEFDLVSSKLFLDDESGAWLLTPDGGNAALDWTGVRVSLGFGFTIYQ